MRNGKLIILYIKTILSRDKKTFFPTLILHSKMLIIILIYCSHRDTSWIYRYVWWKLHPKSWKLYRSEVKLFNCWLPASIIAAFNLLLYWSSSLRGRTWRITICVRYSSRCCIHWTGCCPITINLFQAPGNLDRHFYLCIKTPHHLKKSSE